MTNQELELFSYENTFCNTPLSLAIDLWNCLSDEVEKKVVGLRFGLYGKLPMKREQIADELGYLLGVVELIELVALSKMTKHIKK